MLFSQPVTQNSLRLGRFLVLIPLMLTEHGHATDTAAAAITATAVRAERQLERARDAALRLDYAGIVLQQLGPNAQTLRITHMADAIGLPGSSDSTGSTGTSGSTGAHSDITRVQPLEGPPRDMVRQGARVTWYLPQERVVIHDQLTGTPGFPVLSFGSASALLAHYRTRSLINDRVAGRSSEVLQLQPVDGLRYGYRLWFDAATGLLLRFQSISEAGQVVAQTGFSQLAVWPTSAKRFQWREPDLRGWRTERAVTGPADPLAWSFRLPEGFSRISASRRRVGNAPGSAGDAREVLQILCSDGLAGISIFIEPWSEASSARPVQHGAVNVIGKRVGRFWLTIVGETPMAALRLVADSVEFTAPAIK